MPIRNGIAKYMLIYLIAFAAVTCVDAQLNDGTRVAAR